MADGQEKCDFMMKRSQNKATFTKQNYKSRWFVLSREDLKYLDGNLEKRGKNVKGTIPLRKIKAVEAVEDNVLDNKSNVFQVVYAEGSDYFTLYVVAQRGNQQQDWIDSIRDAATRADAVLMPKFHSGVWTKSLGKYSCCDQIDRNAPGCELTTPEKSNTQIRQNTSHQPSMMRGALPPTPNEKPDKLSEKKIFVAVYDFIPSEDGDLELTQGEEYEVTDDSREHWWQAKNKSGQIGYIPSNYVKRKFDLEIFDWYYKNYSRERSEAILREEGREGCFIVRESSAPGMYTLSLFTSENGGQIRHYHIKKTKEGYFYIAEKYVFPSIADLIHYHKHNSAGLCGKKNSQTGAQICEVDQKAK